jgi:hypothetical protein
MLKQAQKKETIVSARVTDELYELLAEKASEDQRSISNLVSVILTNWQRSQPQEKSGGGEARA